MKRKFAAFDIDGTFYRDALFHDFVHSLCDHGIIDSQSVEKIEAERRNYKERASNESFERYKESLVEAFRVSQTKISKKTLAELTKQLLLKKRNYVYLYTKNLAKRLKKEGYFLITISGSTHEIVEEFAKYHGFDLAVGELNEWGENGFYTGKTVRLTYKEKDKFLEDIVAEHDLTYEGSYAIGDTKGDIDILSVVENPIAFNPSDELYDHAVAHNWKIVVERKNVIYELEPTDNGYILAHPKA